MADKKKEKVQMSALQFLWPYIRPGKAGICGLIVLAMIAAGCSLLGPLLVGWSIDAMVGNGQAALGWGASLALLLVLYLASNGAQWLIGRLSVRFSSVAAQRLRQACFQRLSRLPLRTLDNMRRGDVLNRFTVDVEALSEGLQQGITQLMMNGLLLVGTAVFMVIISPGIAIVVACVTPLSIWVARIIVGRSNGHFKAQSQYTGTLNAMVEEMFTNARTVTAFSMQASLQQAFKEKNAQLYTEGQKAQFVSSLTNPATRFVNSLAYVAVGGIGALMAINGGMTIGGISSLLTYATQFARPINEMTSVTAQLQNAMASAKRIQEVLSQTEEPMDKGTAVEVEPIQGRIEFEKVSFRYEKDRPLLEELSAQMQSGQRIAIVGPTGAGKTTLINLLMRFYEVDSGVILLDGRDIREIKRDSLRTAFGMVLQESALFSTSVHANIAYGQPNATREEVVAAARAVHAHGFIQRLPQGYDTILAAEGADLSQGQRQLITVARAMVADTPMLILDEATSSIDTRTEMHIQQAFEKLMRGRTSFVIAHRLSTIRSADLILVMSDGNIVEQGKHEALLEAKGLYAHLYNSQFAK